MHRVNNIQRLISEKWDLIIIGGGASGLGVALDALSRGMKVALVEKSDFAKGTSSRSTKLIHGGVRYLAQGNLGLVREALLERGYLIKQAPHLVKSQSFIIPIYSIWHQLKYWLGLKIYDLLAGGKNIGSSTLLTKEEVGKKLPQLKKRDLLAGIEYFDGQFDDARLAIALVRTCDELGGCLANYVKVDKLLKNSQGKVSGVGCMDELSGEHFKIKGKVVVNATGVFADKILRLDSPEMKKSIRPSQGIHLVLDKKFFEGESALMIPQTTDGRVLFIVPWNGKIMLGTTDTLRKRVKSEPVALKREIQFVLKNANKYLTQKATLQDVLSVFAGLRPLAAPQNGDAKTKEISRSHKISVSESGLVTLVGGKWTTFRKMGEDTVNKIHKLLNLKSPSKSAGIKLKGYVNPIPNSPFSFYGSDEPEVWKLIEEDAGLKEKLHPDYPFCLAQVVWAVRMEMAHHVEDFLSRRIRILVMDAKSAVEMAPKVAEVMAKELGKNEDWIEKEVKSFQKLAKKYILN
ncbi:glycerol-3-phosphate dehydrogenase/oxidase [Litoribacter ruber]|uniref:glycerol-3-phosphate dehydrogenase/oxidase n=1 Tax=Litoribacter ruber TaxID=702568 RepID=UPI001BD9F56A|nr:glycerol-3-phosphate dehydrogenase/oxidase [Litoribacter ruber]MBT0811007.1 glycerol-3-phosphate dehydrogenase/oxidase [Litoribacter ruber]